MHKKPIPKQYHVDIPDECGWERLSTPDGFKTALRKEMENHFQQAAQTEVVTSGTSAKLQEIIETFEPSKWEEGIQKLTECPFADFLTLPNSIDFKLEKSDLIEAFKKWREETSTSPSQRHMGIYKIVTQEDHDTEDEPHQEYFASIFIDILNVEIEANVSLPRWCNVHSMLIPKDAGSYKVHRYRIINL